jgi:hypothetical protein
MYADHGTLGELARPSNDKEVQPYIDRFAEQHHVDRDLWNKPAGVPSRSELNTVAGHFDAGSRSDRATGSPAVDKAAS